MDASHLTCLSLGALASAALFLAIGLGRGPADRPIRSGMISQIEEQVDASTRHGTSYSREDEVRGSLFSNHLIIDRTGSVEVIPSDRVYRVTFHD
ncbi:hypothetical protein [Tautonia plasticadhaerens]|uniref:hypothetical protein n=1 Tax=Tautonia plasticadhaerens TaxID=2527974 RepID=UPI0011A9E622|nr:hypothetical protein [Tautonia plasticadhaerens]